MTQIIAEPSVIAPVETKRNSLLAVDRCDRCAAQAYVRLEKSGSDIQFCAHHLRAHEAALIGAGFVITVDDRFRLEPEYTRTNEDHA
jgi:hypothetical protein